MVKQLNKQDLLVKGTDRLQFFGQEEGRIRAVNEPANPSTLTALEYDYMIRDHLGNVRMVPTEELKTDAYPAITMEETAQAAVENIYYNNVEVTRVNWPSGCTDTYTNPNDKVAERLRLLWIATRSGERLLISASGELLTSYPLV